MRKNRRATDQQVLTRKDRKLSRWAKNYELKPALRGKPANGLRTPAGLAGRLAAQELRS